MIEDTFEGMEDADLEEDAEKEVDKILWEITAGQWPSLLTPTLLLKCKWISCKCEKIRLKCK